MISAIAFARFTLAVSTAILASSAFARSGDTISYGSAVRPILAEHCFRCHGPDASDRRGDLRLDVRAHAIDRSAIVPHHPESSSLIRRIHAADPADRMPPPEIHKPLSNAQRATLERWIAEGAPYESHWSYVAPRRFDPPHVKDAASVRDPIDAFVLARLEAAGVTPSPETSARTLARRVSLDLIGLPPAPHDVEALVADPGQYAAYVDRLLASPHYGERMATAWLDLARYADTVGYHGDQNLHAFPYRDWVVDAFNSNLPFDRFTILQLAGDLLPGATPEDRVATGFNRLNMVTREGGAQPGEYLAKYAADRVRTVATTWLGSTIGCAECHDHKYDPFTARDFYSLAAFFADVKQWGVYTTYAYTPNPDLPGFTNDHPFPPEIEVDSRYLRSRMERLRASAKTMATEAFAPLLLDNAALAAFEAWRAESIAFLALHPDGFESLAPDVLEPPAARVLDSNVVLPPNDAKKPIRLRITPSSKRVASLAIELVPHPEPGGSILRNGAHDAMVRVHARVVAVNHAGESTHREISFRAAEGERAKPRYTNGHATRGVVGGWWVESGSPGSTATARFLLESPLVLGANETLELTIDGAVTAVRVGASPFAAESAHPSVDFSTLGSSLSAIDAASNPWVRAMYLRSTAFDAARFTSIVALDRDLRECDDGRAKSVVTEAWDPRPTRVLARGDWQDESGEIVLPAPPHFLGRAAIPLDRRPTRLDLANWIVSPENPLTARVFVNRLWKMFFHSALSNVVDDLGTQGEFPSHPELLDTLAIDFRESGYDVKALVRRIVLSTTYRRSSVGREDLRELDPYDRLLARVPPRRLEAEFVRDNALSIAGLLVLDVGGPPVFPYQPAGLYEHLQFPDRDWRPARDDRSWRRAVYTHWQRTFLHPSLVAFDAPSREECVATRTIANTPQQALTLLNDPTFVEAAREFAVSLLEIDGDDATRLDAAYRRALARPPTPDESATLGAYLEKRRSKNRTALENARALIGVGQKAPTDSVDPIELATWTELCRAILNLHETITRN